MSKTCKLMIFFKIVHKNNNKVTLRTLAVNARGQKAHGCLEYQKLAHNSAIDSFSNPEVLAVIALF